MYRDPIPVSSPAHRFNAPLPERLLRTALATAGCFYREGDRERWTPYTNAIVADHDDIRGAITALEVASPLGQSTDDTLLFADKIGEALDELPPMPAEILNWPHSELCKEDQRVRELLTEAIRLGYDSNAGYAIRKDAKAMARLQRAAELPFSSPGLNDRDFRDALKLLPHAHAEIAEIFTPDAGVVIQTFRDVCHGIRWAREEKAKAARHGSAARASESRGRSDHVHGYPDGLLPPDAARASRSSVSMLAPAWPWRSESRAKASR